MDERQLIQQASAGDRQSFAQLFDRYVREAVRAAWLVTRDWGLAEDAVQEAFIRAYAALPGFDLSRPFRPWFYRIVTREALRVLEQRRRLVPVEAAAGWQPAAEEPIGQWETQYQVRTAVMELAPEQRVAVVLKYFLGFTEAEMAEILGVRVSTVKSRLYEARRALERLLSSDRSWVMVGAGQGRARQVMDCGTVGA